MKLGLDNSFIHRRLDFAPYLAANAHHVADSGHSFSVSAWITNSS